MGCEMNIIVAIDRVGVSQLCWVVKLEATDFTTRVFIVKYWQSNLFDKAVASL